MVQYRDAFAEFAATTVALSRAPVSGRAVGDGNSHGFKYIIEDDIHYDRVLLAMIDEISTLLEYDFGRFLLFGYSGGGHFAHRFLHPSGKLLWRFRRCAVVRDASGRQQSVVAGHPEF